MQVSWIDSEQLKGLLQQLQDATPEPAAEPQAWETHTLPEAPVARALAVEPVPAPPERPRAAPEVTSQVEDTPPTAPDLASSPEVARIRDRLREVRERAEAAGLLKKAEPPPILTAPETTTAFQVEEPTVAPAPQIEAAAPPASTELQETNETSTEEKPPSNTGETPEPDRDPTPPMAEADDALTSAVPANAPPEQDDASLYFEVPLGSILERLDAFASWARQRVAPAELLLLDEHGDLLLGAEARAALVLSIMLAANAAQRSTAAAVCEDGARIARQPIPEGGELAVMSCPTRLGLIHLAVEHPTSLPENEARLLRQALMSAVDVAA